MGAVQREGSPLAVARTLHAAHLFIYLFCVLAPFSRALERFGSVSCAPVTASPATGAAFPGLGHGQERSKHCTAGGRGGAGFSPLHQEFGLTVHSVTGISEQTGNRIIHWLVLKHAIKDFML